MASIDLDENPNANVSIVVDIRKEWIPETQSVHDKVRNVLGGEMLDAIINVTGGYAHGGVSTSRGITMQFSSRTIKIEIFKNLQSIVS